MLPRLWAALRKMLNSLSGIATGLLYRWQRRARTTPKHPQFLEERSRTPGALGGISVKGSTGLLGRDGHASLGPDELEDEEPAAPLVVVPACASVARLEVTPGADCADEGDFVLGDSGGKCLQRQFAPGRTGRLLRTGHVKPTQRLRKELPGRPFQPSKILPKFFPSSSHKGAMSTQVGVARLAPNLQEDVNEV